MPRNIRWIEDLSFLTMKTDYEGDDATFRARSWNRKANEGTDCPAQSHANISSREDYVSWGRDTT